MSTSNAFSGVGTLFQRGDEASAQNFATIAEVNSISGPNMTRGVIDVTSLDSTGGYREFIASFRDGGEVVLDMNFTLAGYDDLKLDFEDSDKRHYQIVLPDTGNTTFKFHGLVTALGLAVPNDDKVKATCTVKISGQVELAS